MEQQQAGTDIRYILHVLLEGKWIIVSMIALVVVLAVISNYFQVFNYHSWAQIQIDTPPFLPSPGTDLAAQSSYYQNIDKYFKTEKEKLQSRRMISLFAEQLRQKDPAYQAVSTAEITGQLSSGLMVTPVEDTNLLTVTLTTDNPSKSADWLNRYLELFVAENGNLQETNVKQSRDLLRAQLEEIKSLLSAQQGQTTQYMDSSVTTPGTGGDSEDTDFMFRDQSAYDDAHRKRLDEEAKLKKLEAFLSPGADLGSIPNIESSPSLRTYFERLRDAAASLEKLRMSGKGEEHPSVAAKKLDVQNLDAQIRTELKKTVDSMRLDISVLKNTEERSLQSYRGKLLQRKAKAAQMQEATRLDRAREAWMNASSLVEEKLRSLKVLQSFVTNNISIVERARPDPSPVTRRGVRFVALMGLLGGLIGCGVVVAGEFLNSKIKSMEDIQASVDVPALGFLPKTKDFSLHEIREAYNALRTEVLFRRDTQNNRSFMITSSVPQEGKTTVTLNLGKTLAAAGDRTVVLDFDLRKARLRSLVSDGSQNDERIFAPVDGLKLRLETTDTPLLQVVVPVSLPENAPSILSQPDVRGLIEYLKSRYDWVLIDTPPVTSVTDPIIIASHVDAILFVIKHNFVDKKIVRNSIAALAKVNGKIMGAVLNQMDVKRMRYYAYQGYYRYYSES